MNHLPTAGQRYVGATKFKGFVILVHRFVDNDGEDIYRAILARRVLKEDGTAEWLPGRVKPGDWPTCCCALLDGKMCVDDELDDRPF